MIGRPFRGLAINGKFLAAQPTGVHRVAQELVRQLGRHRDELAELFGGPAVILAPRDARGPAPGDLPVRRGSLLTGQLWEQLELPLRARGTLLLSLCNLSPIAARDTVTMIHDAQTFSTPGSYSRGFRLFYNHIQPLIGARAALVLTVSEFSRGQLAHYRIAPADRIAVIHNGGDHAAAIVPDADIAQRLGLRRGGYVLALASTQPHKNIAMLMQAFAGNAPGDLELVLFGSATPAHFAAAGIAVPASVVFAGRVSDAELAGLMGDALGFAMPSTTEGFGLPPLEAMACACPAVVAPCGALPEICGAAALYAAADDPLAWRGAFARIAAEPGLRSALVAAGQARVRALSWDRAGAALMAQLRALTQECDDRGPAPRAYPPQRAGPAVASSR